MELVNCRKVYENKEVIPKMSMKLENGIYHLKGRNGVGKSVFCRCILGLEDFSEGEVREKGEKILYIPDTPLGEEWLSVEENIDLLLLYYKIRLPEEEKRHIMERICIDDPKQGYQQVSVGTSMKLGLFLLFIEKHWDLIVMDEAMSHIDKEVQDVIWTEMEKRAKEGTTILFVDHNKKTYLDGELWKEIKFGGNV